MRLVGAREGLVSLFGHAAIVALVEAHWVEEQHDLLRELLSDGSFVEQLDDVAVEFGNARHQELVNRYLAGDDVSEADLERVWSSTAGGRQSRVFESPVYAQFRHRPREQTNSPVGSAARPPRRSPV